jgi:hypothetical protein
MIYGNMIVSHNDIKITGERNGDTFGFDSFTYMNPYETNSIINAKAPHYLNVNEAKLKV